VHTDVRLIAATHRDLKVWSEEGKFRPDLYYRLSVFTIHLPPLRERGDDLPLLVQHYLRRFSRELGREVHEVAPEAKTLATGAWDGVVHLWNAATGQHVRSLEVAVAGPKAGNPPVQRGAMKRKEPARKTLDRLGSRRTATKRFHVYVSTTSALGLERAILLRHPASWLGQVQGGDPRPGASRPDDLGVLGLIYLGYGPGNNTGEERFASRASYFS
jgi:DNA-binding NtrC family response regulator